MTNAINLPARSSSSRTRRQMVAGGAFGLFNLATAGAQEPSTRSAKTKTIVETPAIHQEIEFKAEPERIYEALLDSKQFTAFSGGRAAEIHREAGGAFSLFAGHISRTEPGIGPEPPNRPGLACCSVARKHLFDCQVRAFVRSIRGPSHF